MPDSLKSIPEITSHFTIDGLPGYELDDYDVISVVGQLVRKGASVVTVRRSVQDVNQPVPAEPEVIVRGTILPPQATANPIPDGVFEEHTH